jgi:hypothetical protein
VIVGAEAFFSTEITELSRRGHTVGRLLVDVDVDPAVDHDAVQLKQCLSLTRIGRTSMAASGPYFSLFNRREPSMSGCHPYTNETMNEFKRSSPGPLSAMVDL